jgi:hypothetical protein
MRHSLILCSGVFIVFACLTSQLHAQLNNFHKWNFDFGGGVTPVAGYSSGQLKTGWNIVGGGGLNFNSHFGFAGQFMWDGLGVTQSVIQMFHVPTAAAHIWSLTVDPEVRFRSHRRLGFYVIGGGGFYRPTIQFLQPTTEVVNEYCPIFGYFAPAAVPTNTVIGSKTRNAGGINIGGGLTFNIGQTGLKFFTEARYHYIYTPVKPTEIIPITFGVRW